MVICGNLKCKYHSDKNKCTCKKVVLNFNSICTLHQGRQEFLRCSSFEKDKEYEKLEKEIESLLKESD